LEQRIEVNRLENCVQIVKRVSHYLPRSKKKYKTTVVDITIPFEAVRFCGRETPRHTRGVDVNNRGCNKWLA